MKKHKILLLHIAAVCILIFLAFEFAEEIQTMKQALYYKLFPEPVAGATDSQITLYPVENRGDEWFLEHPLIYHAGGQIRGSGYTNSREAVEGTLAAHPGKCFIEMDLRYTGDGTLVCAHSWEDALKGAQEPTLEEFRSWKIQGRFTPLTAAELVQIMRENPRMYLVTDFKDLPGSLSEGVAELVNLCQKDPDLLSRMVIQLYTGREKTSIQAVYPFLDEQFLFTTYEWGIWQHEVAQICNQENVSVIAVPHGEMSDEDAALMRELGFTVYEFTVNRVEEAKRSLDRGIAGFYTDDLWPEDLAE